MTGKELSYINDALNAEKIIIGKYKDYSQQIQDPELKNLCTQHANEHQKHYDKIYSQLNC